MKAKKTQKKLSKDKSQEEKAFLQRVKTLEPSTDEYNEQMRLSYSNPFKRKDFSNARMYWSSAGEIWGRMLIISALVMNIGLCVLFGDTFLDYIFTTLNVNGPQIFNLPLRTISILFMTLLSVIFGLLLSLPLLICNTAGYVHGWGVAYLAIAICYFIGLEFFFVLSLALSQAVAIFNNSANLNYALYFIITTLVITILWIVGACILIVKSDDVRRRVHVE